MTAEVAILNREAVAIAADSAATVNDRTGQKIFSSANKIFSLSKHHPIGIMIYGNAFFMGVPWETIIKLFRKRLGDKKFSKVFEYSEEFIKFIKSDNTIFSEDEQEKYVSGSIYGYFFEIRKEIIKQVEDFIDSNNGIEEKKIKSIVEDILDYDLEKWENGYCNIKNKASAAKAIETKYKEITNSAISEIFEKLPLSAKAKRTLKKIAVQLFLTFPDGIMASGVSGIVVTGFGETEIFPSVASFSIEGIANNTLKYKEDNFQSIDYENSAIIIPFAQMEMVQTFIDGISPLFNNLHTTLIKETIDNYPKIILDNIAVDIDSNERKKLEKHIKKISNSNLEKGIKKIEEIQYRRYIEPILKVVTFLPKNELAEMAESLVNLTCLRKKISMDDETVGGPIDVAVISKGDGLIWIKRKHYFKPELNRHFFINYQNK